MLSLRRWNALGILSVTIFCNLIGRFNNKKLKPLLLQTLAMLWSQLRLIKPHFLAPIFQQLTETNSILSPFSSIWSDFKSVILQLARCNAPKLAPALNERPPRVRTALQSRRGSLLPRQAPASPGDSLTVPASKWPPSSYNGKAIA